ncbi:alpha/beta fold hydrolase [Gordonia sp. HNM0687]|uniref:Alpha/beta fold hydrolase n=1 Tax=Gordonia mangrovi TaxID=2665643 RepID=A0A6L7GS61_9ACTN|nr:alpha/beta hydrolase [Gordonia mangrovi]MDY6808521.1 alpha/beta hydrolase [Actinomycetota bacterium]MXP22804.1 alpha/beta fold hydrolase [Gordonia mangrovi]UVF77119.1 alpha/beta fold hydrolase [Gordonia mangrovi]
MTTSVTELPARLVDPTWLRFVSTSEMTVGYHDRGTGPVLVMIGAWGPRPGATASLAYRAVCDALADRYRCVVVELPNYGLTGPVEYHEPVHDVAVRGVLAVMDHLDIEHAPVIGSSMGATTAIDLALAHPGRVDSLVVGACHASTGGDPYLLSPFPSEVWRLSTELDEDPDSTDRLRRMLRALWYDERLVTDDIVREMIDLRRLRADHGLADRASVSVPHSNMAALAELELPVTVVHGRNDRMVPYEQALAIGSYIAHADIRLLGRCGHWPPFERPDAFVDAVLSHLRRESHR